MTRKKFLLFTLAAFVIILLIRGADLISNYRIIKSFYADGGFLKVIWVSPFILLVCEITAVFLKRIPAIVLSVINMLWGAAVLAVECFWWFVRMMGGMGLDDTGMSPFLSLLFCVVTVAVIVLKAVSSEISRK